MTRPENPQDGALALAGLGLFLPQLVHDINNLCSTLLTCAQFAREAVADDEPAAEDLDEIVATAHLLVDWMRALRPVTQAQTDQVGGRQLRPVDLAEAWSFSRPAMEALLAPVATVRFAADGGPLEITAPPRAVREALLQGALALRLALVGRRPDEVGVQVRLCRGAGGPEAVLEVRGAEGVQDLLRDALTGEGETLGPGGPSARGKAARCGGRWVVEPLPGGFRMALRLGG